MTLPVFKYHPDPIATNSIVEADVKCSCCEQQRGFVYTGPVFAEEELADSICPWCIADGSAHERFNAEFTDSAGITSDSGEQVPSAVVEEVSYRTPGFIGWQQEHWVACCGDAAAFLGRAGRKELKSKWVAAIPALRDEAGLTAEEWNDFANDLDAEKSPTAYVFRCLHCNTLLGYTDCD
jgi:uncharacterized protein CbrC (UPF0167 family)